MVVVVNASCCCREGAVYGCLRVAGMLTLLTTLGQQTATAHACSSSNAVKRTCLHRDLQGPNLHHGDFLWYESAVHLHLNAAARLLQQRG